MKKILFALLTALLLPVVAQAQEKTDDAIIFIMKDGSRYVFNLKNQQGMPSPDIKFDETDVIIKTNETVRLKRSELWGYVFGDYATSISSQNAVTPGVAFEGDVVTLKNQPDGTRAEVFNVSGQLVRSLTVKTGRSVRFSLSGLPSGMYVLRLGSVTHKFLKP